MFVFQAIWENQYYYLFGFLFLVFIILIISCSQIAIVMVYFQLCGEVSGCARVVNYVSVYAGISQSLEREVYPLQQEKKTEFCEVVRCIGVCSWSAAMAVLLACVTM